MTKDLVFYLINGNWYGVRFQVMNEYCQSARVFELYSGVDPDPIIELFVKWDGCMHWKSDGGGWIHSCECGNVDDYPELLRRAFNQCMINMGDKAADFVPVNEPTDDGEPPADHMPGLGEMLAAFGLPQ
jgi:hypothetical protein